MTSKTIVVTGGASGIGKATVLLLAREGARVIIGDIDEVCAETVCREARDHKLAVEFQRLDLTDNGSIDRFSSQVLSQSNGCVDALVNSAGWDVVEPFLQNTPQMWDKIIAINLMGAIRLTRAFIEPMVAANGGKIVNVSSDAGRIGSMGETVYAAAKGGLITFTKSLAREMARHRINVNCICPGPTDTPLFHAQPNQNIKDALIRAIPFRRLGKPEELADAISFFLSNRSDYITGQVLSVSGGLTMVD